jgi:hypothetical protein
MLARLFLFDDLLHPVWVRRIETVRSICITALRIASTGRFSPLESLGIPLPDVIKHYKQRANEDHGHRGQKDPVLCTATALSNQISNQQPARHNCGNCRCLHYAWIGDLHGTHRATRRTKRGALHELRWVNGRICYPFESAPALPTAAQRSASAVMTQTPRKISNAPATTRAVITSTPLRKKWERIRTKIGIAAVSGMTTLTAPKVSATIKRRTPDSPRGRRIRNRSAGARGRRRSRGDRLPASSR